VLLCAIRGGVVLLAYVCWSIWLTLHETDAPNHHGDLVDLIQMQHHASRANHTLQKKSWNEPTTHKETREANPLSESLQIQKVSDQTTKIGVAVTITSCEGSFFITEGAAVLQHSIRRASIHGSLGGKYDYDLYAIYHPDAELCAQTIQDLGYTLLKRDTPVKVDDIKGDFLRERIRTNGCCGEKELIKLEAFTLTQHPIVVLLDLDTLILNPLDPIFDLMLHSIEPPSDHMMWKDKPIPDNITMAYTNDYNMVSPRRKVKPAQGGFLVLRPSLTVYQEFVAVVRNGDYRDTGGWGGKTRKHWGSMTIQGLIPYYIFFLHPGQAVELNRCVYNNMCQQPMTSYNVCFTLQDPCEDCRLRSLEDISMTHFTFCQKPWLCMRHRRDDIGDKMCRRLHGEWFKMRSEMEVSWGRSGWGNSTYVDGDHFYGYCNNFGEKGYELIQKPYGQPAEIV
jgi:hypothetical protein